MAKKSTDGSVGKSSAMIRPTAAPDITILQLSRYGLAQTRVISSDGNKDLSAKADATGAHIINIQNIYIYIYIYNKFYRSTRTQRTALLASKFNNK